MASSVERLLTRFQDNREPIAKWIAIVAIGWACVVLVMSLNVSTIFLAVRYSMPPALLAGFAWALARTVRARRTGLLGMTALWVCLIVIFISQIQYQRLVSAPNVIKQDTQSQQSQ
jgi:hypothetical protein